MTRTPFDDTTDTDESTTDNSDNTSEHTVLFNDPGPITQMKTATDDEPVSETSDDRDSVPNAENVDGADEIWAVLQDDELPAVRGYRGHTTRKRHNHDADKHDITDVFNVNPELVGEVLHFAPDDHAAVHELIARRDELVAADSDVFTDTDDEDEERWHSIETTAPVAYIHESTEQFLIEEFEYDEQFETRRTKWY